MPYTSLCNTPFLPCKKPNGKGWRFVQDLKSTNTIIIPHHSVVSHPYIYHPISLKSDFFSVIDLCSASFSTPVPPDDR